MEHLAKDLSVALEESESCTTITLLDRNSGDTNIKWGRMRRRTRSAGNLRLFGYHSADNHSEDSSSTNSEMRVERKTTRTKLASFHQSDSDEMLSAAVARAVRNKRMKGSISGFMKSGWYKLGINHSLESDSFNENSPARPSLRRKRKFKRMNIDEVPILPTGKRKRSHRLDFVDGNRRGGAHAPRIKPLHQSLVHKIQKFCQSSSSIEEACSNMMETQSADDCDFASESSISWSGGEGGGHDGDDELTDWAPAPAVTSSSATDNNNYGCYGSVGGATGGGGGGGGSSSSMDQSSCGAVASSAAAAAAAAAYDSTDPREIRAGRRRLGDERRPGFTISTGANERIAKFLQDTNKTELKILGAERDKLGQLAALYSLELWFDGSKTSILRKTHKTPKPGASSPMQPPQGLHNHHHHPSKGMLLGGNAAHKRIRTQDHVIS